MNSRLAVSLAPGRSSRVSRPWVADYFQSSPPDELRRLPITSNHAATRAKQRGIKNESVHALIDWADFEVPVGAGCIAVRLARAQYFDSDVRQNLRGAMDSIKNVVLIVDECTGDVVTILHDHGTAKGRIYRKGLRR